MNKKLLVAAIGAAIAAGPMMAQAEVKLYGHAHMSVDMIDQDVSANQDDGGMFVSTNSSRFGIRATEDVGGGLKAVAQYEVLLQQDTVVDTNTNRDNYIGLEGGFGALRLGNIDSATKDIGGIADLFYREQLGESRSIINEGNADARVANGIHYFSPAFGGLNFKAQYGADETTDNNQMGVNVRYAAGPLTLGFGYLSTENTETATVTEDTDVMRAAVKFDVGGGFTVAALWQDISGIAGIDGFDRSAYGLGGSFKTGNNIFKAQYYIADEIDGTDETGGDLIAIGWDHLFSKTVKGYVTYAATSNDDVSCTTPVPGVTATCFVVGGNGHAGVVTAASMPGGGDTSGFSVGMIVDF
jgi:predicted porin